MDIKITVVGQVVTMDQAVRYAAGRPITLSFQGVDHEVSPRDGGPVTVASYDELGKIKFSLGVEVYPRRKSWNGEEYSGPEISIGGCTRGIEDAAEHVAAYQIALQIALAATVLTA